MLRADIQSSEGVTAELRERLSPQQQALAEQLGTIIQSVIDGGLQPEQAARRAALVPEAMTGFQSLAGKVIDVGGHVISFGAENQFGDISIGAIAGRDLITIKVVLPSRDEYYVATFKNPYLGLRPFEYRDAQLFGGRDELVAEIRDVMTRPGAQRVIQIISGPSGCGKSSFAQAGLAPALRAYYTERGRELVIAVMRPGSCPIDALSDAFDRLGCGPLPSEPAAFAAALRPALAAVANPKLLIIDQFEELYTQADAASRDTVLHILSQIPAFSQVATHILITIRNDYLLRLFDFPPLDPPARQFLALRGMDARELRRAISKPLEAMYDGQKQIESVLLDALVEETVGSPARLPLLQVTLEDLWDDGALVLRNYKGLSESIRRRADAVVDFVDYRTTRTQPRSEADRQLIMSIFLDLITVSLEEETLQDARRRRTLHDITRGNDHCARLIDALVHARLLQLSGAADEGSESATVDIIHESLITNWDRLRSAIDAEREPLRQRARLDLAVRDWQRDKSLLLEGRRLDEAESLAKKGYLAPSEPAQELLRQSRERREELRAAEQADENRRKRQRRVIAGVMASLGVLAVIFLIVATVQAQERQRTDAARASEASARQTAVAAQSTAEADRAAAEAGRTIVSAQRLALQADGMRNEDPKTALLLAYEAAGHSESPLTQQALRNTLFQPEVQHILVGHYGSLESAEMSPDGKLVVTGSQDRVARIFTIEGTPVITLTGHTNPVHSAQFSPDGKTVLTASGDSTARLWDLQGEQLREFRSSSDSLWYARFSPDGKRVLTASTDGTATLWDLAGTQLQVFPVTESEIDRKDVRRVAFSPDGKSILTASFNGIADLWGVNGTHIASFKHERGVASAEFQPGPDGRLIVTASVQAWIWDRERPSAPPLELKTSAEVWDTRFTPDGSHVVTASIDGQIQLWSLDGTLVHSLPAHKRQIPGVAFSQDGQWLLSAANDGEARRWSLAELLDVDQSPEQPVAIYGGHTSTVGSVAYSAGGQRIVTAGDDGTVRVWDTQGALIKTIAAHGARIWEVTFDDRCSCAADEDKERMLTASSDGTAKLWDAEGNRVVTLSHSSYLQKGASDDVRGVAFNPANENELLTASADTNARLWNISGTVSYTYTGHTEAVNDVAINRTGTLVATGSDDNAIRLWNKDGTPVKVADDKDWIVYHGGNVTSVAFDRDGRRILSASSDGTARLWGIDGTLFLTLGVRSTDQGRTSSALESASFSKGEEFILTSGWDNTARIWDAHTGELLYVLPYHNDAVYAAAFSPSDLRYVATASRDGLGRIWQIDAAPIASLTTLGHGTWLTSAVYSPDGSQVLTASGDDKAYLWSARGGEPRVFEGHSGNVNSAVFSPDGQYILTASSDKTARLWRLDGTTVLTFTGHTDQVLYATFSPDGKQIATASSDKTFRLWAIDGTPIKTFPGHNAGLYSVQFSPDGTQLLTASDDQTARLWSLDGTPITTFSGHTSDVTSAAFSPDGQFIVTSSWDNTARLWDRTGKQLAVMRHSNYVRWATFSPDGTMILTASGDSLARLWSAKTGDLITTLPGHKSSVQMANFSSDGTHIVTASYDATARQHPVAIKDLLAAAACQVTTRLSDAQITQYDVISPLLIPERPQGCDR